MILFRKDIIFIIIINNKQCISTYNRINSPVAVKHNLSRGSLPAKSTKINQLHDRKETNTYISASGARTFKRNVSALNVYTKSVKLYNSSSDDGEFTKLSFIPLPSSYNIII